MRGFSLGVALLLGCTLSVSFRTRSRKRENKALVLTPEDGEAYIHALATTNRFCPTRCAGKIVQPSNTQELAEWLRANNDTSFTVKGGGHSYGCQSVPEDGGVMIHTGKLNDARVFRRPNGTAYLRTGTGLTFDEVVPRLAKMGYSMPHGECITVGMGGWHMNIGQHPELKNFENEWGYKGQAYLTKATFVNYAGTIFTVDKKGIHLVELGKESLITWFNRAEVSKAKALLMNWAASAINAVSNTMRLFNVFGASLAIATELEIELIPKPEPPFLQATYGMSELLDDTDGKGQQLMQAIFDAVNNAGEDPDLDCGIFYASHYYKGTLEGAIALKCVDWASDDGANIKRYAPPGYRSIEHKGSAFMFWTVDSYGKGWLPMWHAEDLVNFIKIGGVEKYRQFLRTLEYGDVEGANPCDACSSELMYMLEPSPEPQVMFDGFCTAGPSNQNTCTAFMERAKDVFLDDGRRIFYKQNLPSCAANPDWMTECSEYSSGGWLLGQGLKHMWDARNKVSFWLGLGGKDNGAACEALLGVQTAGATCQEYGITPEDLAEAERAKAREKCPDWAKFNDFDSQNNGCTAHIYRVATPLPAADIDSE